MATTYENLINRGGTIYNTTTNKGYATPTELAADLGISANQIDWNKISQGTTTPTPTQYSDLINKEGTIYNTKTNQAYSSPEELAKSMGISAMPENWQNKLSPTPTSSTDISMGNGESPNLPDQQAPTIKDAYAASMLDTLAKQKEYINTVEAKRLEETQKQLEESKKAYDDLLKQQKKESVDVQDPTKEATYAQEQRIRQNQLDFAEQESKTMAENAAMSQKLVGELDSLLTGIQAEVLRQKSITGLSSIRQPQIEKSVEEQTARLGVVQAVLEQRAGRVTAASNAIINAQNAMSADRTDRLKYYQALNNFYANQVDTEGKKIITLTASEQAQIDNQIATLKADMEKTQNNVDNIQKLMTDPDTALLVANAGVTLNDTPEQVQQKFANYAYQKEVADTSNEMSKNGYQYITAQQAATKPSNEVQAVTDSKGVTKYFWKKVEDANVTQLMKEYPDAGILPTDTFAVAKGKLSSSKIYQQQTRLADGGNTKITITEAVMQMSDTIQNDLNYVSKRDGKTYKYVNPTMWRQYKEQWISETGLSGTEFIKQFGQYLPPTTIDKEGAIKLSDYGDDESLYKSRTSL